MEPLLRDMTFLTHSLSAHHLTSEDMSQLSFSLGHIENIISDDCSFAMTYWSHVKITNSAFSRPRQNEIPSLHILRYENGI